MGWYNRVSNPGGGAGKGNHFVSRNIAMIEGDSCYHRRHEKGRFKGLQTPCGALVEFMPQNDMNIESIGSKTLQEIFLGYHVQSGGLWSCDYIVADYEPFKDNCAALESRVKTHRIKEVLKSLNGVFTFPVAEMRRERGLRDHGFGAPEAVPDLVENIDTAARPQGEEATSATAEHADELSAKAEVPLGTDERGLGNETFPGRDDALDKK